MEIERKRCFHQIYGFFFHKRQEIHKKKIVITGQLFMGPFLITFLENYSKAMGHVQ